MPKATRLETTPPAQHRTVLAESIAPAQPGNEAMGGGAAQSAMSAQPIAGRRLVGVLAAPGLGLNGSVFAVRQGKNLIGSDRASDICLGADPRVSVEHALLLHRGRGFYLADRMSTNGTWVNDQEVPANGTVVLRDRDRLRCGGVEMIFFMIERVAEDAVDTSLTES
jgi:pSer/pThr/pTyr-binding forkhead associated (FHA) protein